MAERFHFDLENGDEIIRDREGAEASGLEEAVVYALSVIAEMRESGEILEMSGWTLVIRDGDGTDVRRMRVE